MSFNKYQKLILIFSDRLFSLEEDFSLLHYLSWKPHIKEDFIKSGYKKFPQISSKDFIDIPNGYIDNKLTEINKFIKDLKSTELSNEPIGELLIDIATNLYNSVLMVNSRGTDKLYLISKKLYGHPNQTIPNSSITILEVAKKLDSILTKTDPKDYKSISSKELATELKQKISKHFNEEDKPKIILTQNMDSDCAVSNDSLYIRTNGKFIEQDVDMLFVHEILTHYISFTNAKQQNNCKWLSVPLPQTEILQEGLSVFNEILTKKTYPKRLKKIVNRVLAIDKAENGISFQELFEWHKEKGMDEKSACNSTERVFKGCQTNGRGYCFTRDITYLKGFILVYLFIENCLRNNEEDLLQQLFNGHTTFSYLPVMKQLEHEGIIKAPKYIPSFYRDKEKLTELINDNKLIGIIKKMI